MSVRLCQKKAQHQLLMGVIDLALDGAAGMQSDTIVQKLDVAWAR